MSVAVEFVLVILGVLIALQVNNWNEARQADYQAGAIPGPLQRVRASITS